MDRGGEDEEPGDAYFVEKNRRGGRRTRCLAMVNIHGGHGHRQKTINVDVERSSRRVRKER